MTYDFLDKLDWSRGLSQSDDLSTLRTMIAGCTDVRICTETEDRSGNDYVVTLRRGAQVYVDAKNRDAGCSKYWKGQPEFALERWSVMPGGRFNTPDDKKKIGWTLCESKQTDLILFKFHPRDCQSAYLVSYQLLRIAFRRFCESWFEKYGSKLQSSVKYGVGWQSEAVFVPQGVVYDAIRAVSIQSVAA